MHIRSGDYLWAAFRSHERNLIALQIGLGWERDRAKQFLEKARAIALTSPGCSAGHAERMGVQFMWNELDPSEALEKLKGYVDMTNRHYARFGYRMGE